MEMKMNIPSKSFVTGALAIVMATAAFTASMATSAEASGPHPFRHAVRYCYNKSPHPFHCFNRVYGRAYGVGYGLGYGVGYGAVNNCGWHITTFKKWNAAHTRLLVVKDRVWTCY
jgi:hypothetical protein